MSQRKRSVVQAVTAKVNAATKGKGYTSYTADDNVGNTATVVKTASQAAARTYTIPDTGADASFIMSALAQTIGGIKTFSSMFRIPIGADVAAAGNSQGTAAALVEGFQVVTGADGTKGVVLPTGVAGAIVIIKGTTSGVLKVYPASGGTINALSQDAAMSLASGVIPAIFIAKTATQWYTLPLLPS